VGEIANQWASAGAFEDFHDRLTPNTLRRHLIDLTLFTQYLAQAGIVLDAEEMFRDPNRWAGVTWGMVEGFVKWMLREGYAIGSINVRMSTVKTYCRLASKAGAISGEDYGRIALVRGYSPMHGRNADHNRAVTRKGTKKAQPVSITREHADRLKRMHDDSPQGRRDALLMCLLLDHGLRCGEIVALPHDAINLSEGTLRFYRPKVDKQQIHHLTRDSLQAAIRYFEVCSPSGKLIMGSRKNGKLVGSMSERAITDRVRVIGESAGIEGLSAHDGRHYWATAAIRGGTDVRSLQDAGGWSNPIMPLRYAEASKIANQGVKLG